MGDSLEPLAAAEITREELYHLVWAQPLNRVATRFGISATKLGKICDAHRIPRPRLGHWMCIETGRAVEVYPLEAAQNEALQTIIIVPTTRRPAKVDAFQEQQAAEGEHFIVPLQSPYTRPHPLVAEWIATRRQQVEQREGIYHPLLKRMIIPVPLTVADRRLMLVASSLFKALEMRGVLTTMTDRQVLEMQLGQERLEVRLRYRLKREKRPIIDALGRRLQAKAARQPIFELVETNSLYFELKSTLPKDFPKLWEDSKLGRLEARLGEIVRGIMAAFPALQMLRMQREQHALRRANAAQEQEREAEATKLENARLRRLVEHAGRARRIACTRAFLAELRASIPANSKPIAGTDVDEWLNLLEAKLDKHDLLSIDPRAILVSVVAGEALD